MSFTRVNPGGWAAGAKLTSAQQNQLDIDHANALDKSTAGDTLLGTVSINAAPAQISCNRASAISLNTPGALSGNATHAVTGGVSGWFTPGVSGGVFFDVASGAACLAQAALYASVASGITSTIAGGIASGVSGGIALLRYNVVIPASYPCDSGGVIDDRIVAGVPGSYTVTLPTTPADGREITVSDPMAIASLSVTATNAKISTGAGVYGSGTGTVTVSLTTGLSYTWCYNQAHNTWHRVA
jgi:hypothetical protein